MVGWFVGVYALVCGLKFSTVIGLFVVLCLFRRGWCALVCVGIL